MSAGKISPFSLRLDQFSRSMHKKGSERTPKIILIIMANIHDPEIAKGCGKDMKSVRKIFKHICRHTHTGYCDIEISGHDYNRENLLKAIDRIEPFNNDIVVFYYSGHGFSYEKDARRKFPQIDLRAHNNTVRYNEIDFINQHTENLTVIMELLRFRGGRINMVISDCCNSNVPYQRGKKSMQEMDIVTKLLPPSSQKMTRRLFSDAQHSVSILAAASGHGQFAISDPKIGSIFTHYFTRAIAASLSHDSDEDPYLPWRQLLDKTAEQTFNLSKGYDIGGGKPGHQQPVFEILIEDEKKM